MKNIAQILTIAVSLAIVSACSDGDQAAVSGIQSTTAAAAASSKRSDRISCDEYFVEFREAVLGKLRGTEDLSLLTHVVAASASAVVSIADTAVSSDEPPRVNKSICNYAASRLRKVRVADTHAPRTLAPACEAMVEQIDAMCLRPLVDHGYALSTDCERKLIAVGSFDRATTDAEFSQNDSCALM